MKTRPRPSDPSDSNYKWITIPLQANPFIGQISTSTLPSPGEDTDLLIHPYLEDSNNIHNVLKWLSTDVSHLVNRIQVSKYHPVHGWWNFPTVNMQIFIITDNFDKWYYFESEDELKITVWAHALSQGLGIYGAFEELLTRRPAD